MSYQQYFVVIALVIPVFFLTHIVQFGKFSKRAAEKVWLLLLYGVFVLGFSAIGEVTALQYVWKTGLPMYSADMPPDDSLTAARQWLDGIIFFLITATLVPALLGSPAKPITPPSAAARNSPTSTQSAPESSANRIRTAVGVTAAATALLMLLGQRRRRR